MASLQFDKDKVNLIAYAKNQTGLNYRTGPGTNYKILGTAPYNKSYGRTTGNYYQMSDGIWYQVLLNGKDSYAFVRNDVTRLAKPTKNPVTSSDSKKVIDGLVNNDMKINESLIRTANLLQSLKNKGVKTDSYNNEYKSLLNRYIQRQNKIKNSKILKWKTGLKRGYEKLSVGFKTFLSTQFGINISGIGAIPIIAVVVSAVAGAGLAVLAYFAFKPEYDESKTDYKKIIELENVLNKVDPNTAGKIRQEIEKQIDTAYYKGETSGKFSGAFKIVKPLAMAFLGFWGITKFLDSQKNKK